MIERQHPRFAHHADVTIALRGTILSGQTVNVSRGGMCALLDVAISVGAELTVELSLRFDDGATSEGIALRSRAVWCTPIHGRYQVGFSFLQLPAEAQQDLELFLRFLDQRVAPSRM